MLNLCKVNMSVVNGSKKNYKHFCYVDNRLKQEFDRKCNQGGIPMAQLITHWCIEEFGFDPTATLGGFEELKKSIHDKYCALYPEIASENTIDRNAWRRTWVTDKIKFEMENKDKLDKLRKSDPELAQFEGEDYE